MNLIYRGYDIKFDKEKLWQIFKDGKFVCAQPSEQFAYKWIDNEKKNPHPLDRPKGA